MGYNVIDELIRNLRSSEFGVFVFAPDDRLSSRGNRLPAIRDNVLFEFGMFVGQLGKERSFIIKPSGRDLRIPSDLLGILPGEYESQRNDASWTAALGPVCNQISLAMQRELKNDTERVNLLVKGSLETACRAMSVPTTPEKASLRAFIFRKEDDALVCRYFYDPNPSDAEVGLTFTVDRATAKEVVVVRCFLDKRSRNSDDYTEASEVGPLSNNLRIPKGQPSGKLKYVLAAPIRKEGDVDSIWGVVDFDASNKKGIKLLQGEGSGTVITRLAKELATVVR